MTQPAATKPRRNGGDLAERAVVDIGSNTVRLVIYGAPSRVPSVLLNEKVVARLGRELESTGLIPDAALEIALLALHRYAMLLSDRQLDDLHVVATAAVREAGNGQRFLQYVNSLGLEARLLSGEEEALAAAHGVIGAFPDAHGVVADLGGGSLELVSVKNQECHDGTSLPLGTLRLPHLRAQGEHHFREAIEKALGRAGWAHSHSGPLYMVGGTWRAMAKYIMRKSDHPLSDPHALVMPTDDVAEAVSRLALLDSDELKTGFGLTDNRAEALPDAAAMLGIVLEQLSPESLIFSSWGLREGLLYQQLDPLVRRQDPLLTSVAEFSTIRGGNPALATHVAAWSVGVVEGGEEGSERLRLAATMLSLAATRIEPNWRARHALDWALHKRWIGCDIPGRAQMAAALWAACGSTKLPKELERLASEKALEQAVAWGLAIRLCHRLGGGAQISLSASKLRRENNSLILELDKKRADLAAQSVENDLDNLADWLGLEAQIRLTDTGG